MRGWQRRWRWPTPAADPQNRRQPRRQPSRQHLGRATVKILPTASGLLAAWAVCATAAGLAKPRPAVGHRPRPHQDPALEPPAAACAGGGQSARRRPGRRSRHRRAGLPPAGAAPDGADVSCTAAGLSGWRSPTHFSTSVAPGGCKTTSAPAAGATACRRWWAAWTRTARCCAPTRRWNRPPVSSGRCSWCGQRRPARADHPRQAPA